MTVVLHTLQGDLPVNLYYSECPKAAFNFLALCASGGYDGCQFYRHFRGALLQTGDPTNTGKGGSSIYERLPADASDISVPRGRFFADEGFGVVSHARRGVLSMAHRGPKPDTNASQFMVLCAPLPAYDGVYTAFGEVLTGAYYDERRHTLVARRGASGGGSDREPTGEEVLQALERAAALTDEKGMVLDRESLTITGTTVLYNPFAEGKAHV